jgi:hypothetical protein
LDRNLGATQVATSSTDYLAYGDLFQWGRGADGHQLITWTNSTTGTAVNGTTSTLSTSDTPGHGNFITNGADWRNPKNDNLWQGVNGTNNPCPSGYRVPTETELNNERASWSTSNAAGAYASPIKLITAGIRENAGFWHESHVYYWSSTVASTDARVLYFRTDVAVMLSAGGRRYGSAIRCIKD